MGLLLYAKYGANRTIDVALKNNMALTAPLTLLSHVSVERAVALLEAGWRVLSHGAFAR
jgi:hypothetical protein